MSDFSYDVSAGDFAEKVIAASSRAPVLVDFWAEWCQPCKVLKPILEKLAGEYGGRFLLAKVNSDENQELAARYGVRGIPAVKAFIDGQLVDEFTGAQPEALVRQFLDRLLPSPAEPLRLEALAAYERGDREGARRLLGEALKLDPANENACLDYAEVCLETGAGEEAGEILTALAGKARDADRHRALTARLALASAAGDDPAALQARIAGDPADLDARLQLANSLALAGSYAAAFDQLLEIVRRDRRWRDEAGRKAILNLFSLLTAEGQYDDLVRKYRTDLARLLN